MNRVKLMEQLKLHEDERLWLYDDATGKRIVKGYTLVGNPSIGIGRNLVNPISREESQFLLNSDIDIARKSAEMLPWYSRLNDVRQNVIVELIFNMGALKFSSFRDFQAAMANQDWNSAAAELLDSKWQKEVDPILWDGKGRADTLSRQIRTGEFL